MGKIIAENEVTKGGVCSLQAFNMNANHAQPVILTQIENELQETTHSANNTLVIYMEQIEAAFRDAGVTVYIAQIFFGLDIYLM